MFQFRRMEVEPLIEIRWATEQEVMAVSGEVPLSAPITDILDDWQAVAMHPAPDRPPGLHLVGIRRSTSGPICTSPVVVFDPTHGRARTATGSLYLLGTEGDSPTIGLLCCG